MSRQLTAHHEAGHAVAAVALGIGVARVSVVGDCTTLGRIVLDLGWPHLRPGFDPHHPEDRRVTEAWILLSLTGEIADAYHDGRNPDFNNPGARWDFHHAEALAECLFAQPGERKAFFKEMQWRAQSFVQDPLRWRQISAVASHLARLGELNRPQLEQIMAEIAAAGDPSESS